MKRHVHIWKELLPRCRGDRTTFVYCPECAKNHRATDKYLNREATAEFRRQIKYGIKPRFIKNTLIGYDWSKK